MLRLHMACAGLLLASTAMAADPPPEIRRPVAPPQADGVPHTLRTIPEACARIEGRFTGDAAAPYALGAVRTGPRCRARAALEQIGGRDRPLGERAEDEFRARDLRAVRHRKGQRGVGLDEGEGVLTSGFDDVLVLEDVEELELGAAAVLRGSEDVALPPLREVQPREGEPVAGAGDGVWICVWPWRRHRCCRYGDRYPCAHHG